MTNNYHVKVIFGGNVWGKNTIQDDKALPDCFTANVIVFFIRYKTPARYIR